MRATHGAVVYELDDQWWRDAGMAAFVPRWPAYRAGVPERSGYAVVEVAIADVAPIERQLSHGVFNDSAEFGTARDRVLRILTGFVEDQPIPPVEVVKATDGPYRYHLNHGVHRFCCAVLAGFVAVPAVDVTEPEVVDSDFDRWMQEHEGMRKGSTSGRTRG
jgi:hypothetical protein